MCVKLLKSLLQFFILDKKPSRKICEVPICDNFWFTLCKFFLLWKVSLGVVLWKSDTPVSTKQVLQKLCGFLVRSESIKEGSVDF